MKPDELAPSTLTPEPALLLLGLLTRQLRDPRWSPTLGQADGLGDLESVYSTQVPTRVQRDDPGLVLYVTVAGGDAGALDVDVSGTMTQGGPAWGGGG